MVPSDRMVLPDVCEIPGVIVDFLRRASVAIGCTRGPDLLPHIHGVSGWEVGEDGRSLLCLIPQAFTAGLLESLRDNGLFTVTVERIGPHETYQFKGTYLDSRPADEGDRAIAASCRRRFAEAVGRMDARLDLSPAMLHAYILEPAIAVRIAVREIYVQTPGPGAGRRLVPREAA